MTMPNNYVLLPGFDVDKKELEEKKLADAIPAVNQINASISKMCIRDRGEAVIKESDLPAIEAKMLEGRFL